MAAVAALLGVAIAVASILLRAERSAEPERVPPANGAPGVARPDEHDRAQASERSAPRSTAMPTDPAATPQRPRAVIARGTVSSADGKAVVGADVCPAPSGFAPGSLSECTTSGAAGEYSLSLPPGGDLLIASAAAFESEARSIDATADLEQVDFVLRPARPPNVKGAVVDATGGPIAGAIVLAQHSETEKALGSARTDESGRFGMAIEPGRVTLVARAESYAPARVDVESPAERVTLALAAMSTLTGIVLEDASERPVAGVTVTVCATSALHGLATQVITDAAGRFELPGLNAGGYVLRAASGEWGGGTATVTLAVAQLSEPVELRVRAAATLTGVIRVAGEACAEGSIGIESEGAVLGAVANASGEVSVPGVLPGRYDVTVSCSRGVTLTEQILIGAGPLHREWQLDAGATVHGRVVRASGAAVERSSVQMLPAAAEAEANAPQGSPVACEEGGGGEFVCRGLLPGRYELGLGSPDPIIVGSMVIGAADPPPVVLRMPAAASLLVQLESSGISPGSGFTVMARGSRGRLIGEATQDGHLFRDVPLGAYSIYLGPTSAIPADAPRVSLGTDGELARVTLKPPHTLTISGVLTDAAGSPMPEIWLHAESVVPDFLQRGSGRPALTNELGEFVLTGLVPGSYSLLRNEADTPELVTVSAGSRDLLLRVRD